MEQCPILTNQIAVFVGVVIATGHFVVYLIALLKILGRPLQLSPPHAAVMTLQEYVMNLTRRKRNLSIFFMTSQRRINVAVG
jgi:hypothetical protein